jgi:hypothetical protein
MSSITGVIDDEVNIKTDTFTSPSAHCTDGTLHTSDDELEDSEEVDDSSNGAWPLDAAEDTTGSGVRHTVCALGGSD